MDSFDHKMSKSDPGNAILLDDEHESIRSKMRKAFLEVGNQKSPVFEISRHIIIPKIGKITVSPDPKYGEASNGGMHSRLSTQSRMGQYTHWMQRWRLPMASLKYYLQFLTISLKNKTSWNLSTISPAITSFLPIVLLKGGNSTGIIM